MEENKKILKIRLKSGDTAKMIFDFLKTVEADEIYFVLDRDFLIITEHSFLKRFKETLLEFKGSVTFITEKKYFQQVLKDQELKHVAKDSELFLAETIQNLQHFFGKVEAEKNKVENKKIDFKPKIQSTARPKFSTKKIEKNAPQKSLRGVYFFVFLLIIIGLGGVFLLISPQVMIVVKPKISTVETTQNVLIGLPEAVYDEADKDLPKVSGILVETELESEESFPSTGREYSVTNARGKITLFNESPTSKYLLASRLSTADNVIVRMQKPATIPPKKDGKAGSVVVEVVADEYDEKKHPIGSRGNLDPDTDLFFPALREEAQKLYYGKTNLGPLVGGSTLTKYFIADTDFENAKKLLEETFKIRAIEKLQDELKKRSNREGKQYIFLDNPQLLISELLSYVYDATLIRAAKEAFSVKGKMKTSGLVFDQEQVVEILSGILRKNEDSRKKIIQIDPDSIEYRILDISQFAGKKWVKLSVTIMGIEALDFEADNEYAKEWQQTLKKEILGKSVNEARGILLNRSEIERILLLKISPFWVKKIPLLVDQVRLKVKY